MPEMQVIFVLPSVRRFRDRVELLLEVSEHVDRVTLIIGRNEEEIAAPNYKNLLVLDAGFRAGNYPYNALKASYLASRHSREGRFTIYHDTGGYFLPLFMLGKRSRNIAFVTSFFLMCGWSRKRVWSEHGLVGMLKGSEGRRVLLGEAIQRMLCFVADRIVLQAEGNKALLCESTGVQPWRLHVLHNNFAESFWKPDEERKEFGKDGLKILYAGRVRFFKGIYHIIDVCKEMKELGAEFRFSVVGDWESSSEKEKCLRLVEGMGLGGNIFFMPRVGRNELKELFRRNDVLVYQSLDEGSPRIVLEAIGTGLPVIASKHPGILELDHRGEFIEFTEYGDVRGIVNALLGFRKDPQELAIRASKGRKHVFEKFSTPAIAEEYVRFYESIPGSLSGGGARKT